ncbi:unnamed protein product [Clonostachys solani]|uniref:2EXR domain-containing protein n=1 Tax=Clonostachys solani TaxID=160281 RepID=A0A9N9VZ66_9HYPO|nr:unnamed protein product [Clonostachys solani]
MEAPTTFHLFSKLPAELRLRIWEFNLPAWRIVPLRCGSDISAPPPSSLGPDPDDATTNQSLTGSKPAAIDCSSSALIPANLHTCVESRTQALSHYSLSFSFARQPPHVFFDPRTDILYFGPRHDGYMAANAQFHTAMSLIRPDHLAAARRIAIDDALFQVLTPPSSLPSSSSPPPGDPSSSSPLLYHSSLAVSLTADCLRQLRRRMPDLEEIFFVPHAPAWHADDPLLVCDTLAYQVQTAIRDVSDQLASSGCEPWTPPRWKILPGPLSDPGPGHAPSLVCY